MRKYWEFFKASYQITFSYRVAILVRLVRDVINALFFIVLWAALFRNQILINGFTFESIVTYYILVRVLNQLYAYEPAHELNRDIKQGDLSNYLVKPLGYLRYLVFFVLGRRLARVILTIIFVTILFIVAPGWTVYPTNLLSIFAFILSAILAWLLLFEIAVLIGSLSFWFSETGNVRYAFDGFAGVLGGLWIPLNMFPDEFQKLLNYLPFKYLFSFPASVYQENIVGAALGKALAIQLLWILIIGCLVNFFFKKGVAKYESYGK